MTLQLMQNPMETRDAVRLNVGGIFDSPLASAFDGVNVAGRRGGRRPPGPDQRGSAFARASGPADGIFPEGPDPARGPSAEADEELPERIRRKMRQAEQVNPGE